MEHFETRQLFVRLVTPTFFVIITVIQLHYFHKEYMEITEARSSIVPDLASDPTSLQGGLGSISSEKSDTDTTYIIDLTELGSEQKANRVSNSYRYVGFFQM